MADKGQLAELASLWLTMRRHRERFFPHELFDEHAWDMLLFLFAAETEGREVTDEELIASTSGRVPNGLRWMTHLEKEGEITRETQDDGRIVVRLTRDGSNRMQRFLESALRFGEQVGRADDQSSPRQTGS